ncbi:MAG: hypothetical protein P1V51_24580 [Deltaproteobacteria bacterium]|nr:hypothetical protein [Deltaproteobacteria bacterium]
MAAQVIPFPRHRWARESILERGDEVRAGDRRQCPECGEVVTYQPLYRHLLKASCRCGFNHLISSSGEASSEVPAS